MSENDALLHMIELYDCGHLDQAYPWLIEEIEKFRLDHPEPEPVSVAVLAKVHDELSEDLLELADA